MSYSESDTRSKFIDPMLINSWRAEEYIIREHYFTDGRKLVGNKRWERCFADYILKYNWINLAIIEAKSYDKEPTEWLEQVKKYGDKLQVRFVYTTNWKEIYEFDLQIGRWDFIEHYPTPEELYSRIIWPQETLKQHILGQPYYLTWGMKPRYYQEIAIQKALEAIAGWNERILLALATGTWKTFIAFQIAYKLFQAKRSKDNTERRPRILFLADRNILINQAMNTFNPLEKDIVKITGTEIKKRNGKIPTNANIFFAIYQAIIGDKIEEEENYEEEDLKSYYKQYQSDFFDLVIIDECHRGGANESGSRHDILKHFSKAVHLWMTATPKRDDNIDTYKYFGDPIYQYSLKDWINDGFLSPYKVKRIRTNIDELVLTSQDTVVKWQAEKTVYELSDFDKNIIIPERNDLIAQSILSNMNPLDKTIIFCVDQPHALRMRDSINKYKTIKNSDYCVRVTSDEGEIWRNFLEKFQDNDKTIPTILTSSQMLTTWVDAKNVRNIVLLRNIGSMVEFKQIIGRWTRLFEGKDFFTILDFTWATNKFYDEDWDGDALNEVDENVDTDVTTSESAAVHEKPFSSDKEKKEYKERLEVRLADDRILKIVNIETRYIDEHGKPVSATDFLKNLIGKLPEFYKDEAQLRSLRANPETRESLLTKLSHLGIDSEQLESLKRMFEADDSDIFDILAHISFNSNIKKRVERVAYVKNTQIVFDHYENLKAQEFLDFILEQYAEHGIFELQKNNLSKLIDLSKQWSVSDMVTVFGGENKLKTAYYELQEGLFRI